MIIHKYAGWYAMTHWDDRKTALCGATVVNKNQRWRWAKVTCEKCLLYKRVRNENN